MGGAQGNVVTGAVNLTTRNSWRIAGAANFNADDVLDIVWQYPVSGAAQIWYMGGAQGNVITGARVLSSTTWRIAAVLDLNHDGRPDVIFQDPVTGASQAWFLGGAEGTSGLSR